MGQRLIGIAPELIIGLLRTFNSGVQVGDQVVRVIHNQIPDDAEMVGWSVNGQGAFTLLVESAEFSDVPEGQAIPYRDPVLQTTSVD